MAECKRRGLYPPSMKRKTAIRASAWVLNFRQSMSSVSREAKTLSHMALS